ncbi:MAG: hypothetical protein O7F71_12885 [Gammaproteobacteria bacterium]|nr:hypothetical protein [Gammaproteobacteria bacterium]
MSERAQKLHATPWQGVFYLTGGGSEILPELLTQAGASKTVLETRVPYASAALAELLGQKPEQACSDPTTRSLAMAAFQRARSLSDARTFGFACTASLATEVEKRGKHRAHIALQTEHATTAFAVNLKGNRADEERGLLEHLWHALDISLDLELDLPDAVPMTSKRTKAQGYWRELILGEITAHTTSEHNGKLIFPGAFNPLHKGHEKMLEIAEAKTGLTGAYELSISNVDKPLLDYTEIGSRLEQFSNPVWLTRLPTFLDKARQFRAAHFVLGTDTMNRINDAKYYGSASARDDALNELVDLDCRFVVFGRATTDGFFTLGDIPGLPKGITSRCIEIKRTEFEETISSTALRSSIT